jgi:hypothetical protein
MEGITFAKFIIIPLHPKNQKFLIFPWKKKSTYTTNAKYGQTIQARTMPTHQPGPIFFCFLSAEK